MDRGTVEADGARRVLGEGGAVVLPNPAPLTMVVAGTEPRAVNTAKGRPAEQAVALWAHHRDTFEALEAALDLGPADVAAARRLLVDERVTLLLPLRSPDRQPPWLVPASVDGWSLVFGARWTPLLPVLEEFPVLYVSSANRTARPPAATAADAVTMFAPNTPVLGSASLPDAHAGASASVRRATTTLRLHRDGRLDLYREGAQNAAFPSRTHYLDHARAIARGDGPHPA